MPFDLPALNQLLSILFTQESEFEPNEKLQLKALTTILYNSHVGDIFVVSKSGEIIAMVTLLYTISTALGGTVAMLEDMIVHPKDRDKKVGKTLIQYAINHAKDIGCKRITLLTDKDNVLAHEFYVKSGFKHSSMVVFRKKF
ncbi:GNAT family N-acetyltransferase [bacterium]|nr:GNAT family N-acetyltransferase [bacterium]MBU1958044.1 GNAT family N-acetyltransferase [bacterium]